MKGLSLMRFPQWSVAPEDTTRVQKQNFYYSQMDAVGIGLSATASSFLPVFLTRLGATSFQVGLLTVMPAIAGFLLSMAIGRFLQSRRNIIPWFSGARLWVVSSYALTGLAPLFVPRAYLVLAILLIWAAATIPQDLVNIAFSVVMNAVAGPRHRYDLLTRRWSILGLVTAVATAGVGQFLVRGSFPVNYQIAFLVLSLGGLISYYYSSRIQLPDTEQLPPSRASMAEHMSSLVDLVRGESAFVSFSIKRFIFFCGTSLAVPILPLYYVRVLNASDAWIGFVATAQTASTLIGYSLWTRQSRKRGSHFVLLCTTFGLAAYLLLVASTRQIASIALYAALAGIFQAGLDLVFFDELMKTIPPEQSATFVAIAQSLQHLSAIIAPMLGTLLSNSIGIAGALAVAGLLRLAGFVLFAGRQRVAMLRRLFG